MEDWIVPLVLLYLLIIRPLYRRLKAAAEQEGEDVSPGRRAPRWIQKILERLREAAEAAQQQGKQEQPPGKAFDWDQLFDTADEVPEEAGPPPRDSGVQAAQPELEPSELFPEPAAAPPPEEPEASPIKAVSEAPPLGAGGRLPRDLRQAVIWSEILGPPVALRDG